MSFFIKVNSSLLDGTLLRRVYLSRSLRVNCLLLEWTSFFKKGMFVSIRKSQFFAFRLDPFSDECVCLSS